MLLGYALLLGLCPNLDHVHVTNILDLREMSSVSQFDFAVVFTNCYSYTRNVKFDQGFRKNDQ